jgi:hypothetical protein
MRKNLAEEKGKRKKFKAIFVRLGKKVNYKGYSEDTILLKDVLDLENNKLVTDHCWFSYTKGFEKISLTEGAALEFEARVKEYKKGYVRKDLKINNRTTDYKLSHPTKIRKVN